MDELVWIKQQLVWLCTGLQLSLNLEGSKQYKTYIIIFILTCCHFSVAPGCSSTAGRQGKDGTFLGWLGRKRSLSLPITRQVSRQEMFFPLNPSTHQKTWTFAHFCCIQPVAVERKVPVLDRFSSEVPVNFLYRRFVRAGALKISTWVLARVFSTHSECTEALGMSQPRGGGASCSVMSATSWPWLCLDSDLKWAATWQPCWNMCFLKAHLSVLHNKMLVLAKESLKMQLIDEVWFSYWIYTCKPFFSLFNFVKIECRKSCSVALHLNPG